MYWRKTCHVKTKCQKWFSLANNGPRLIPRPLNYNQSGHGAWTWDVHHFRHHADNNHYWPFIRSSIVTLVNYYCILSGILSFSKKDESSSIGQVPASNKMAILHVDTFVVRNCVASGLCFHYFLSEHIVVTKLLASTHCPTWKQNKFSLKRADGEVVFTAAKANTFPGMSSELSTQSVRCAPSRTGFEMYRSIRCSNFCSGGS